MLSSRKNEKLQRISSPRTTLNLYRTITYDKQWNGKRLTVKSHLISKLNDELDNVPYDLEIIELSPDNETSLTYVLKQVPVNILKFTSLRILILDTNNLTSVPSDIGQLLCLQVLILSNNLLETLPNEFNALNRLNSLHLSNNLFKQVPICIYSMCELKFLDLTKNFITFLQDDIGTLKQLRYLSLHQNQLKTLPMTIGNLTYLETLWLGENNLSQLPKTIINLTHLDWWHTSSSTKFFLEHSLDGNPLIRPPLSTIHNGYRATLEYFENEYTN
ncbi:unnamed protein product [Didymodactylos carnosus]|uniref:Disease resistance R13L4/SHOC-2-like LRR domain-containing protein n=1 Tax=Didymodactylos carnosus TaxID=1234261 RepID=A0A815AW73_9BILA|nr:unnamed protein product [Didymodactylos carnosus]CAF0762729.1 unnamed protein product [Didymodactylos carnosus]CAF1261623.1 unnamed protein product [Didymodactylos carnosus]CAF3542619.1 unnamed protein product [Didymodactylos carnosus]CAF3542640.1 unnamed protein product [Didymodactylos carnosus]